MAEDILLIFTGQQSHVVFHSFFQLIYLADCLQNHIPVQYNYEKKKIKSWRDPDE